MLFRPAPWSLLVLAALAAPAGAGAVPPGRQHVLTIEGQNTVTYVPQAGLEPSKFDYKAQVEYIVNNRDAEPAADTNEVSAKSAAPAVKIRRKSSGKAGVKAASAVDIVIHSTESKFRHNEQTVLESRLSRSRFQGKINPDAPAVDVSMKNAPLALQQVLRSFDTTAATMLVDEDSKVVSRKFRTDVPFHAIVETLLSIHTPIPRAVAFWEAPTRLAMGHGQTARGTLRFEKEKESVAKTGGLVKVKVSGVLKAEGAIVGHFIKNGTYKVTGEQIYEPSSREWKSARWSVVVDHELTNAAGLPIARASGTMSVVSRLFDEPAPATTAEAVFTKP